MQGGAENDHSFGSGIIQAGALPSKIPRQDARKPVNIHQNIIQ